jgi:hypothetical protein
MDSEEYLVIFPIVSFYFFKKFRGEDKYCGPGKDQSIKGCDKRLTER